MPRIRLLVFIVMMWMTPSHAQAQTPSQEQLQWQSLDVMYRANLDGTITVRYAVSVSGEIPEPQRIPWTLPVPGEVIEVTLEDLADFEVLDAATLIIPDAIQQPCDLSPLLVHGYGLGYFNFYEQITGVGVPQILDTQEGQRVVVDLKLTPHPLKGIDADVYNTVLHQSPVVAITYQPDGSTDEFGLNLASLTPLPASFPLDASARSVRVNVYVAADSLYTVLNAPIAAPVDVASLRNPTHQIASTLRDTEAGPGTYAEPRTLYEDAAADARSAAAVNGARAFLIPHADTVAHTLADTHDSASYGFSRRLEQVLGEAENITRLNGLFQPASTPELIFAPTRAQASTTTNLIAQIDPVYFQGCTTETLYDPELERALPAERVYVDALRFYVPLLEGWTLYAIDPNADRGEMIISGEDAVELEDTSGLVFVAAESIYSGSVRYQLRSGEFREPMLVLEPFRAQYNAGEGPYFDSAPNVELSFRDSIYAPTPLTASSRIWYWADADTAAADMYSRESGGFAHGVKVSMIAPLANYSVNEEHYMHILDYLTTYQYFTHPDLRHTLFYGDLRHFIQVGYPQGWHTREDATLGRLMLPLEAGRQPRDLPYARIQRLDQSETATYLQQRSADAPSNLDTDQPIAFEHGERRGYFRVSRHQNDRFYTMLVEFSAPTRTYSTYADLLLTMATAMRSEHDDQP